MDLKKFGNFNRIEMNSKEQNLDLTGTKQIHFNSFSFAGIHFNRMNIDLEILYFSKYFRHVSTFVSRLN